MTNSEKWDAFISKNKEHVYHALAKNGKYDGSGHLMCSEKDPWMQDNVWDSDLPRLENGAKLRAAN